MIIRNQREFADMKSYIPSWVLLAVLYFTALAKTTPNLSQLSVFRNSFSGKCRDCVCGVNKSVRIVGGSLADRRNFPWLAQIKYNGRMWCGGSLVTRKHILTAAHCVHNKLASSFTVYLGDGQHAIRQIREHREYNVGVLYNNDIALIELYNHVTLSPKVRTICLPERDARLDDNKMASSVGWGATHQGGSTVSELQKVDLPIISKSECSKTSYSSGQLTDNMFCAGYITGGKDACQGDSGGPLQMHEDGKGTVLVGIVSWGIGCAKSGYPGIYTQVSRYIDWIETFTYNECLCPSMNEKVHLN